MATKSGALAVDVGFSQIATAAIGQEVVVFGLVFTNSTAASRTVTLRIYVQSEGAAVDVPFEIAAKQKTAWEKAIGLQPGDTLSVAADAAGVRLLFSTDTDDGTDPVSAGLTPRGPFSNLATYSVNDFVETDGSTYVSLVDGNAGNAPATSPAYWMLFAQVPQALVDASVANAVGALIDGAPGALDTLNELAAALGDDANFAATVAAQVALKANSASPTLTGTIALNGNVDVSGRFGVGATITDVVAGHQDNYNPAGWSDAVAVRIAPDAAGLMITGISGGAAGRLAVFHNIGPQPVAFMGENAGSLAANRIQVDEGSDVILYPNAGAMFLYDEVSSRWRVINRGFAKASHATIRAGSGLGAVATTYDMDATLEPVVIADAATIAWNLVIAPDAVVTIAGSRTIGAPTGAKIGKIYSLRIESTGAFLPAFNSCFDFGSNGAGAFPSGAGKYGVLDAECLSLAPLKFRSNLWKGA